MDAVEHAAPGAQKPHTTAAEILNFKESIEENTNVKAVLVRLAEKHPFLTHGRARDLSRTRNTEKEIVALEESYLSMALILEFQNTRNRQCE